MILRWLRLWAPLLVVLVWAVAHELAGHAAVEPWAPVGLLMVAGAVWVHAGEMRRRG